MKKIMHEVGFEPTRLSPTELETVPLTARAFVLNNI